jgi:hypothetical protein
MHIECEIQIKRQPPKVFALLTDPERLPEWQSSTVAVRRQRQGLLTIGEHFDEVHKALGRELAWTVEVAAYEVSRLFALNIVEAAMPLDGRWQLESPADGTRLRFTGEADVRGTNVAPIAMSSIP